MSTEAKATQVIALLQQAGQRYPNIVFANSLGAEDMVMTDLLSRLGVDIPMFTLDTGRLHAETYRLMDQIRERYSLPLQLYFPDSEAVTKLFAEQGANGFYQSIEQRQRCCHVRKVEPLQRALQGQQAWITGLRRQQSPTRQSLNQIEWDEAHQMHKINPLLDWSETEIWDYIHSHDLPYNSLHEQGYASIGCSPCTRAIQPGENIRAGRWWWEQPESRECGLHV